jgi:vacuolar-type H+-ATPase subunit F/Vma7
MLKMKLLVITTDELCCGFNLAGIRTIPVKDSEEAKEKIIEQINYKKPFIILIDEELFKDFDDKLKKKDF